MFREKVWPRCNLCRLKIITEPHFKARAQSTGRNHRHLSGAPCCGMPEIFLFGSFSRLFARAPGANLFGYQRIKVLVSGCWSSNIAREPFGEILLLLNLDRSAVKDVSNSYIAPGHKSDKLELKQPGRRLLSPSSEPS
jgi:hypothetical protein